MNKMIKFYIEFKSENNLFKAVVPAKNLGQAIIIAWQMVKPYAANAGENVLNYEMNSRRADKSEEYGWKLEELNKED